MRRLPVWILCSLVLATSVPTRPAVAETSFSVGLQLGDRYRGPDLGFYDEPNVVAVPGRTGVYYVQGRDQDVYRYNNNWYMNYNGDWYRANSYRGPFTFVGYRSVPQNVYSVPVGYRSWTDYRDAHYNWGRSDNYGGTTVNTGLGISLRLGDRYRGPDLGFTDEPDVYPISGRPGVYYVRDSRNDVYRYGNNWYMNYNGDWYRASSYRGPWVFVSYRSVPRSIYTVPSQYRRSWRDYRDTHYNWGSQNTRYGYGRTGGSITLRIGDPYRGPNLGFYDTPTLTRVPGTGGLYYVSDSDHDVYRYGNFWYMNYNGDWYRASSYRGPWIFVGFRSVPRVVYTVPTNYRRRWTDYRDRHYNWSTSSRYDDNDVGIDNASISLRIGDRYRGPTISFETEPRLTQAGQGVYYVEDSDNDIYRYGNTWFMNYNGDWYRANSYNGPWAFVGFRSVPRSIYSVPSTYRRNWSDYRDRHYDWDDNDRE